MKYCIIFFFAITVLPSMAQTADDSFPQPPSHRFHTPKSFLFLDITHSSWMNAPSGVTTQFLGGGFNFNLLYDIHIAESFSIAPGLSYSVTGVKNNASVSYQTSADGKQVVYTNLAPIPDSVGYLKNKFSSSFIDIPIDFRIRIKPDARGRNFWLAPGFRAGLLVGDFWKFKFQDSYGDKEKTKTYNIKNVLPYHYGVSFRAGYYKFGLFGFYSLSNLFEKGKGPDMNLFSAGITFNPL